MCLKYVLTSTVVLVAIQAYASDNLIINGDFETPLLINPQQPKGYGYWQGNASEIIIPEVVDAYDGKYVLKFLHGANSHVTSSNHTCSVSQLVNIEPFKSDIEEQCMLLSASAHFNRVVGDNETDTQFEVLLYALSGDPNNFPNNWGGPAEKVIKYSSKLLYSDDDPLTWEALNISLLLPSETDYVGITIQAVENIYNDDEPNSIEFDGHYADGISITMSNVAGSGELKGDMNRDCKIDFYDIAEMLSHWMECNLEPEELCWQ